MHGVPVMLTCLSPVMWDQLAVVRVVVLCREKDWLKNLPTRTLGKSNRIRKNITQKNSFLLTACSFIVFFSLISSNLFITLVYMDWLLTVNFYSFTFLYKYILYYFTITKSKIWVTNIKTSSQQSAQTGFPDILTKLTQPNPFIQLIL